MVEMVSRAEMSEKSCPCASRDTASEKSERRCGYVICIADS